MTPAVIGFAVFPFIIFFVAALILNKRKNREAAWQQVAEERGLQFFAGSWTTQASIAGSINGFFVSVDTQRVRGDDNYVTRYTIGYPSNARQIELSKQSALHFTLVKRLMGKNDVEIGDPGFDDKVLIDAHDPVAAARYLSPARRDAVLRLFGTRTFRNPTVTNTSLVVDTSGIESSPVILRRTISALLEIAAVMSAPTDVDIAAAVEEVPPEKPVVQDAIIETDAVIQTAMNDTVIEEEPVETIAIEEHPVDTVVEADPADHPQPDPTRPLDHESVVNDLFESGRMGFETDQHFATAYAGAPIRWVGTVDTIRTYRNDADFDGPGIKATFLLGDIEQAIMRSRMAKAVVQLPEGTTIDRGQEVEFEGTLLRADRFTRRVFIANGTIHT